MSDPWEDEGFGAEDDWAGDKGLEGVAEDDVLAGLGGDLDEPDAEDAEDAELDDDTLTDED